MPTHQDTLTIQRDFPAKPEKVFAAMASVEAKAIWFRGPASWRETERSLDLRPGGTEVMKGTFDPDFKTSFTAHYYDVVPNERLVYSFDVVLQDVIFSASLVSIELEATATGTRMSFVEQITYIDNEDPVKAQADRYVGTNGHFDALAKYLQSS